MFISTLLLTGTLAAAGSVSIVEPTAWPPEHAGNAEASGYKRSLATLRDATTATNIDPVVGAIALADALTEILDYAPLLAADPSGRELQVMGELALARAALLRGEQTEANRIVDRLLTILFVGEELERLDRAKLGPRLDALLAERVAKSPRERLTRLALTCSSTCSVYVDGRMIDAALATGAGVPLTIGHHAIWIEGTGRPPLRERVIVEALDARLELSFVAIEAPPPRLVHPDGSSADVPPPPTKVKRLAPRALEISLLAAGLAGVGAGTALLAIDGSCAGAGSRLGAGACPNLYETRTGGISTLTLGASVLITGSILLALDERQRRHRGAKQ